MHTKQTLLTELHSQSLHVEHMVLMFCPDRRLAWTEGSDSHRICESKVILIVYAEKEDAKKVSQLKRGKSTL